MIKEQLLTRLTEKLGTTGLSERTLSEYVDRILPTLTSDEQANDAFYETHVGILKTVEGQLNKEVADRVNAAKEAWAKAHPASDPKPNPNPNPDPAGEPKALRAALDAMKVQLSELKEQMDANMAANAAKALKDSVMTAMRAKNANDEAVLLYTFKGEEMDTKKSVEELTEAYLKNYDANYKLLKGDGASPRDGGGSGGGEGKDSYIDDFFAQKTAEGKFPAQGE